MSEAFEAIAGEVLALASEVKAENAELYDDFLDKSVRVGKIIFRGSVRAALKAGTLGILDSDSLNQFGELREELASEAGAISDVFLRSQLEGHKEQKKAFESFRQALESLSCGLNVGTIEKTSKNSEGESVEPFGHRPLVFIIDELDRCRPTFALEMLEKVKHFFSVPGVHFVLGTHLKQLENSVRFAYGPEIEAATYLQKFYHLIVQLPEGSNREYERYSKKYLVKIFDQLPKDDEGGQFTSTLITMIDHFVHANQLTFRTIDRIATSISIVVASTNKRNLRIAPIIGGLCIMKVLEPDLYKKARRGQATIAEIEKFFGFENWGEDSLVGERTRKWWEYCVVPNLDESEGLWQNFAQGLFRFNIDDRHEIVPILATRFVDRFMVPD